MRSDAPTFVVELREPLQVSHGEWLEKSLKNAWLFSLVGMAWPIRRKRATLSLTVHVTDDETRKM